MRHLLAGIAALVLGLAVLPAFADDKDKKDPAPDAKKDDAANTEKTIKAGSVGGKVVEVNETAKSLKVEVVIEYSKPNIGEIQAMEQAKVNYAQALAKRDINGALSAQRDMAYHAARTSQVERKTQQVDVASTDDVKVRQAEPPPTYDDKGNIKKRTEKELKELKGDPKDPDSKLPGYPAQWSDVKQGAYVKVTLVKKKEVHHEGPKPKDADPDPLGDNMPQASLILILADPMPAK
jgi:hypothetical protein